MSRWRSQHFRYDGPSHEPVKVTPRLGWGGGLHVWCSCGWDGEVRALHPRWAAAIKVGEGETR